MDTNTINVISHLIQALSLLIASLSCFIALKALHFNKIQFKIDRLLNIYSKFLESSPSDKIDQGYILRPELAFLFVAELSTYDKTLMRCNNELKILTFNDDSKVAKNLRTSFENARNLYRTFYVKLSLYINSEYYKNDITNAEKLSNEKFHIEITPQSLAFNTPLRNFYAQQLEKTEGIRSVSQALENLKTALKDENFDAYFYAYLKELSS